MVRTAILFPLLLTAVPASAAPVDAADDFLRAVEWYDGEALLSTLSESLRNTLESRWTEFTLLASERPEIAGAVLSRALPYISPEDAAGLSLGEFLSILLPHLDLSGYESEMVTRLTAEMTGREALVVMTWPDGRSVDFDMVWEDGAWRIAGSALLDSLLQGIF
jgi:hypothetical protein